MYELIKEHQHLPIPLKAPHMVEVLISSVTHCKELRRQCESISNKCSCFTIVQLKKYTYHETTEYTYEQSHTHEQEPPPPGIMEFQFQTANRNC